MIPMGGFDDEGLSLFGILLKIIRMSQQREANTASVDPAKEK